MQRAASPSLSHGLSYLMTGITDRRAFLDTMLDLLPRLLPCDSIGWNALDAERGTAIIDGRPREVYDGPLSPQLLVELDDHPMVTSYLADLTDTSPRRLSDVVSTGDLHRTRTYAELLRPLDMHQQLTVVTGLGPGPARCWTFTRSVTPFSDDELGLATTLQPVLVALDGYAVPCLEPDPEVESAGSSGAPYDVERVGLTGREREVLALVAQGATAVACGHLLRIAPGTVRKHLEHAYDKLGVHDRLLAVQRARDLGLIPPPSRHWPGDTPVKVPCR